MGRGSTCGCRCGTLNVPCTAANSTLLLAQATNLHDFSLLGASYLAALEDVPSLQNSAVKMKCYHFYQRLACHPKGWPPPAPSPRAPPRFLIFQHHYTPIEELKPWITGHLLQVWNFTFFLPKRVQNSQLTPHSGLDCQLFQLKHGHINISCVYLHEKECNGSKKALKTKWDWLGGAVQGTTVHSRRLSFRTGQGQ